ncbi:HIT family protein [Immundisolibacter sp.]|uniref:HIT family protein n=1 Tax=Immundisolibacter sp. TaxID=1934948 RepID=UPI002634CBDA|nr:HIT family protein [Immundisolibacter sp.]MDD3650576.1 HIT family protein [Immundisolibacter sp.]
MNPHDCPLCRPRGENVLWQDADTRVVRVDDPAYPGFCRVILNAHVAEMTDLAPALRDRLMQRVFAVEAALRHTLQPAKINLASLGNQVPHLHWHVIARFVDDATFPDAVWAPPRRAGAARRIDSAALERAVRDALAALAADA